MMFRKILRLLCGAHSSQFKEITCLNNVFQNKFWVILVVIEALLVLSAPLHEQTKKLRTLKQLKTCIY